MSFNNEFEQHKNKLASGLVLAICLLLPFFALYWMVPFIGKYVIGNDYTKYSIDNQMFLRFSLSNGTFPLYAPGFNGGWSSSALTLGQLYHPISWLAAITPGYWNGFALQINTFFRLVELGGTCAVVFLFLRKLRLSIPLAFILSFITVFNLRMLDMFRYGASLESYTAMLLLCTAVGWSYLSPNNRFLLFCISVCSWLLIVGGHPQIALIGFLGTVVVYIVFPFYVSCLLPDEHPPDFRRVFRFWGWSAFSVMLGILMASAYILPLYFEYLKESFRGAGGDFAWACTDQDTLTGIICNFFNPFFSDVHTAFGGSSLILLAILVPLAGLFYLPRAWPIFVIWASSVVVLILAAGSNGPLYYYFWKYFPFAQAFRIPGRLCTVIPFAFMLILAWILQQKPVRLQVGQRGLSLDPVAMVALVALALFVVRKIFAYSALVEPHRFVPLNLNNIPIPSAAVYLFFLSGLVCLASVIIYRMSDKFKTLAVVCILASVLVASTTALRYGTWIEPGTFKTKTYAQMLSSQKQRLSYRADTGDRSRDLINEHLKHTFLEPALARICRKYQFVGSQREAYLRLNELREIDLVYVQDWPGPQLVSQPVDSNLDTDSIRLNYNSFNNFIYDVFSAQPAFFVFSYPCSSQWQAKIDGINTQIYRCNALEQGIWLSPGKHSVEFRYRSPASVVGVVLGCLAIIVVVWTLSKNSGSKKIKWLALTITATFSCLLFAVWFRSLYKGGSIGSDYIWTRQQIQPNLSSRFNLAYGKHTFIYKVLANSYFFDSSIGVDGSRDDSFGFMSDNREHAWWLVDLGVVEPVGEIVIYKMCGDYSSYAVPFDVLFSKNGQQWSRVSSVVSAGQGNYWHIGVPNINTRFVCLQTQRKGMLAFSEVEIYK